MALISAPLIPAAIFESAFSDLLAGGIFPDPDLAVPVDGRVASEFHIGAGFGAWRVLVLEPLSSRLGTRPTGSSGRRLSPHGPRDGPCSAGELAIVEGAPFWIAQDFPGLVNPAHPGLRLGRRIGIRVVFAGEAPVGGADLDFGRGAGNFKGGVVVWFRAGHGTGKW